MNGEDFVSELKKMDGHQNLTFKDMAIGHNFNVWFNGKIWCISTESIKTFFNELEVVGNECIEIVNLSLNGYFVGEILTGNIHKVIE